MASLRAFFIICVALLGLRAGQLLFLVPRTVGSSGSPPLVQPRGNGAGISATTVTNNAAGLNCIVGAAISLVAVSVHAARKRTRQQRAMPVAMKALGSINQFKVFGPKEDPFEIETDKIIGVGGQGTVYICHRQSNPDVKYAVKTIPIWRLLMDPSSAEKIKEIRKEVDVLERIQGHRNVCECIGCYDAFRPGTSEAQYIMLVMEKIEGGELASYIKDIKDGQKYMDESTAKSVLRQTIEGLQYIHSKDVVHRDLKAENILVCGQELTPMTQIKLIDFGVAKAVDQSVAKSCVGTTEIMAPELVSAKLMMAPKGVSLERHGPYTFKSPREMSPGFGIVSQRPDGKGAMVNGIEAGGQAEVQGVGDGWAISAIDGVDITEKPFVKDFNEIGAGTKAGVLAIAEMLGALDGDFTMEFIELPKREFTMQVDVWSLGVTLYAMLAGVVPFKDENEIVNGEYNKAALDHCSPEAKDLVNRLLQLNPNNRPTLEEVISHPWMAF